MTTKTLALGITVDLPQIRTELQKLGSEIQDFFKGSGTSGMQKEVQQGAGLFDAYGKEIKKVADTMKSELAPATEKAGASTKSLYGDILNLRGGIKGFITDMEMMIKVQMRWYAARTILFAIPQTLAAGIEFKAEINKAEAMLLRWGATSGQVTAQMKQDVHALVLEIRQDILQIPVTFDNATKAVEAFVGAGMSLQNVRAITPDILKLTAAFPEINMEQFSIALVGTINTFKDMIKGADTFDGKMRIVIEQLLRAQAVGIIRPEQFTKVLQYMGEMSKLAGFTTEQMFALAVAVTDTGVQSSRAARLISSVMSALTGDKATKALHSIGIEVDKNKTLAEQFIPIMTALKSKLGMEGGGAATVGAMAFLSNLTSKDQMRILLAIMDTLDRYKDRLKDIQGAAGGLGAASDTVTNTLSSQWIILKSITNELGGMFFSSETLGTGLTGLIEILKGLGWVMSGLYGVLGLFTEGLKGLYYSTRSLTDPLMGLLLALKQVATGDTKAALETLKSIPKAFSEMQGKGYDILMGAPEKIAKEVQDIQNILYGKVPRVKGEPAGATVGKPGAVDLPEKATKSFYSQMLSYQKEFMNASIAIEKSYQSLYLSELDNLHKLGLISEEDYYTRKRQQITESIDRELADVRTQKMRMEAEYKTELPKVKAKAKSPEEVLDFKWKYLAGMEQLNAKEIQLENTKNEKIDDWDAQEVLRKRNRHLDLMNFELDITGMTTEQRLAIIQDGYKKEESLVKWLYDNQAMDAKSYYTKLEDLANNELADNKKSLLKKLNDFLAEKDAEIAYLRAQGVIDENQYITLNEAKTKYQLQINGEIVKSEQDTADKRIQIHREAADSIEYIWQTLGTKGVLGKVFKDIKKEWGGIWQSMYDTLKEIFQDLKSNISDVFFDAMQGKTKSWYDYFMSLLSAIERRLADMAAQWIVGGNTGSGGLIGLISSALGLAGGGSTAGGAWSASGASVGAGSSLFQNFMNLGKASGGDVYPWGIYPVGERGVELFKPATSGTIIPNSQIGSKQSAPTTIINNHFHINAMDAQSFESWGYRNRKSFGNIMLAAAADNHRVRRQG